MIKRLLKNKKFILIIGLLILIASIAVPSFCISIYQNSHTNSDIALSFASGNGSEEHPYIISNREELNYFNKRVSEGDTFNGKHIKLSNNIYINEGVLDYDKNSNSLKYIVDSKTYYLKDMYDNTYYYDVTCTNPAGNLNTIYSQGNGVFSGFFDGNNYFIYGIYLLDNSLFYDLQGTLKNLKISNSIIISGKESNLIHSANNADIHNLYYNGVIYSEPKEEQSISGSLENINLNNESRKIKIIPDSLNDRINIKSIRLHGNYEISEEGSISINGEVLSNNQFDINVFNNSFDVITNSDAILKNINYEMVFTHSSVSLIGSVNNSTISTTVIKGYISGDNASGIITDASGNLSLQYIYNAAEINSIKLSSGIINNVFNSTLNINQAYNCGNLYSINNASGFINTLEDTSYEIKNSFNCGELNGTNKYPFGFKISNSNGTNSYYYTNTNISSEIGIYKNYSDLLKANNLMDELDYKNYSKDNLSEGHVWIFNDDNDNAPPILWFVSYNKPNVKISYGSMMWSNEKSVLELKRVKSQSSFKITYDYVDNENTDVLKVEYYLRNGFNTSGTIDYSSVEWKIYKEKIPVEYNGVYTLYAKVTDVYGNVSYANTDILSFDGFNYEVTEGSKFNQLNENKEYLSDVIINSEFKRQIRYQNYPYKNGKYIFGEKNLIPNGTMLILTDKIRNKVYYYIVNQEDMININKEINGEEQLFYCYDFSNFKNVDTNESFNNDTLLYYSNGNFNEDFIISIYCENFNYSSIQINSPNIFLLDNNVIMCDSDVDEIITIYDFDQYKSSLKISTDHNNAINFVSNNKDTITIDSDILPSDSEKDLYDPTFYNNLYYNISISDGKKIINSNSVSYISYDLNGKTYYANKDGITRIPCTLKQENINININANPRELDNGVYYINIYKYISYDKNKKSNIITIPLNVNNSKKISNSTFKFKISNKDRIIDKASQKTLNNDNKIDLSLYYFGDLNNPFITIKVSKKMNLSSLNQNYEVIDFNSIFSNNFYSYKENEYYLSKNISSSYEYTYELNPIFSNFENGSYKIIISLYDSDALVRSIEKTILIK